MSLGLRESGWRLGQRKRLGHIGPSWTVVRTLGCGLDRVSDSEHECDII